MELSHVYLIEDFTSSGERFDEDGLLIRDVFRNCVQVYQRQSQIFCKRPIVVHDPKDCPARAMRFQSTAAESADWFEAIARARDIDFPADFAAKPLLLYGCRNASYLLDLADKLMARRAAEFVVAAKNFHIGVADTRQPHANQRPPGPQLRQWLRGCLQFSISTRQESTGL